MPKPESREQGAPIQYFTREKTKKQPDFRVANQKAYDAANEQIMLWHAQYARDFGRLPPSYATGRDVPREEPTPFKPSKPKKTTRTGTGGGKGITIDESKPKKEQTEREQTESLKARKELVNGIIDQLKVDTESSAVKAEIPGVTKKEKGWFERNIGAKVGGLGKEIGETVVGDVAARGVNLASRIPEAATAFFQSAAESGAQLSSDPLRGGGTGPTGDPKTLPEYKKWPKEKQRAADAAYKELLEQRTNPFGEAWKGLQGKRKGVSWSDYYTKKALAERGEVSDTEKALNIGGGFATDVTIDPQNALGFGLVAKGVRTVRKGRKAEEVVSAVRETRLATKVAQETKDAVRGRNVADDVLSRIGGEVPTAPRELAAGPRIMGELGTGKPTSTGFEFTDDITAAARADEVAQAARKSGEIKDATEAGFRTLRNETAKAARAVESAKAMVKRGAISGTDDLVTSRAAAHASLLKRMEAAQSVRQVAKITPVGKSTSLLEKQVERLTKLSDKAPNNPELVKKLAVANRDLQAARLAALPDNADKIMDIVKGVAKGEKVTVGKEAVDAVVNASPKVQDQLLALIKDAESKTAVGQAVKTTGDSAELPSTKFIAAINKATDEATATAASKATISDAAKIVADPNASDKATQIALDLLNDAGTFGRPLTKAGIRSKTTREALKLVEDAGVQERALRATGRKVAELKATGEKLIPSAQKAAMFNDSLLEEVLPTVEAMTRILEEGIGKRFAIRFAGKDLGEFAPVGASLRAMYMPFELVGGLGRTGPGQTFAKAFRMGAHFPDETNYLRQMAENSGVATHKEWADEITEKFTNTITQSEARQIRHAIEGEYPLENPHLEELRQLAIQRSDEIFQQQAAIGKYAPGEKVSGYVHHYYHSRNKAAIKSFKDGRTADLRAGRKGATIETAKGAGLKPEDRIDRILIMQHRDFVRDLQRANFRQSVISSFGVKTDNAAFANGLGLEEVSGKSLNKKFQDVAAAEKSKWYLPPEIHETFKAMDALTTIGRNGDADNYLTAYDSFVRMFKTSATIGNPGNWVNNTAGDFFLNWVDGVKSPTWYKRAAGALRKGGQAEAKTISLGGQSFKTEDVLKAFRTKAPSGGFIRTEGLGHISRFEAKGIKGKPGRAGRWVQGAYETREEWVRLAHFMHAVDDEMRNLARKGVSQAKIFDSATELAAKRVAKWNIDYTAITPFERSIRKRVIPFYTFMRKATPLMLEAMITRPGKIAHYNMAQRAVEQMMGVPPMEDDGTVWPTWARQQGITRLTSEDEPLYIRDPSPLNVINRLTGGDSPRSPVFNMLNMSAPPIKGVMELGTGQSLYNQRPINNWDAWMAGQIPTLSIIQRLRGHPLSPQKTTGDGEGGSPGSAIIERIPGVPIGRMTENRQQAELYKQIGDKSAIFRQVNEAIAPWEIRKTHSEKRGSYYVVKDPNGKIVSRHRDYNMAVRAAQR